MKKQFLLLAIAGGALAVATPQVQAQLPAQTFNPNSYKAASLPDAQSFSVTGEIPEFLVLSKVDNKLELGDLGSPTFVGRAMTTTQGSTGGAPSSGAGQTAFVKNTGADSGAVGQDGTAGVEIQANTFVKIVGTSTPVVNLGPDGIVSADDITLATRLRGSVKGRVMYNVANGAETGFLGGYSPAPGGTTYDVDGYASYYGSNQAAETSVTGFNFTFAPGPRPGGSGYDTPGAGGPQNADANNASGFRIAAEVDRHGLNDYKGTYSSTINLTYYKF